MAYIGKTPTIGNFQVCDAISVVNNQAAYTMQVGGVNVSPESANHMLVSLNGILQSPTSSFTVSSSTITFASNLVTGDVIDFIQILGNVLDLGVPSDSTVSLAKLTATGTKDATTFLRGDNTFAAPSAGFTLSSTVATTSGTAIDFTGIPSTARLIILNFFDYSKSGGNSTLIQLGTSGGFVTSGYISAGVRTTTGPSIGAANKTDGFGVPDENGGYETAGQAIITCVDVSNNKWIYSFTGRGDSSLTMTAGGFIALGGTLTQIKVRPSGSDTFDTGAINLQYI